MKIKIIFFDLLLLLIIISLILWFTGIFEFWFRGLPAITNNIGTFTDSQSGYIKGEYTVSIDLDDLKSNIGKILYDGKECKIYVNNLYNEIDQGTIEFKTSGEISLTGATLVSGVREHYVDEPGIMPQGFNFDFVAKMTAEYEGKKYDCEMQGAGPIYYYGDYFCFYLPTELYEMGEKPGGTITLTITNLYKNVWTRK